MAMHGRTLLLLTEMLSHGFEAMKYILYVRGVFRTYAVRARRRSTFSLSSTMATGNSTMEPQLDDEGKESLRESLNSDLLTWRKNLCNPRCLID